MDTYTLQRAILSADLTPTEKLVGMALSLHMDRQTASIRVQQLTTARECGLSARAVRRAVKELVSAGVFSAKRTGRATVMVPTVASGTGKKTGIVERPLVSYQIGHCVLSEHKKRHSFFDLDTELSSRAEEECKREERRFQKEKELAVAQRHAPPSAPTDAP